LYLFDGRIIRITCSDHGAAQNPPRSRSCRNRRRARQAAVIADFDGWTADERGLVLRLASLLGHPRRIISIETDLVFERIGRCGLTLAELLLHTVRPPPL
jgi:hypothetical protein